MAYALALSTDGKVKFLIEIGAPSAQPVAQPKPEPVVVKQPEPFVFKPEPLIIQPIVEEAKI